ncbi:hypothetical protein DFJ58DRAFT_191096 [Suillus subalutaceus]|uniref:uncharacterized protein n=1 Tax=Suillus subalutaceus TaxID=48586 RepID=UPI001B86E27D|nr:uncharacterized protein DFJ58DRAFT_191096 [Suillus subalutaceus]KAG1836082.1 hypothetical protein DFJ58DRAFT_191096 [Suillus subalutaceus]
MDDSQGDKGIPSGRCYSACRFFIFILPLLSHFYSSDFENKFVCGEIMTYEDLKEHRSEAAVKAAGKLRP